MAEFKPQFEPPKLDLTVDRYCAFKAWKDRWVDYAVVTELNQKPGEYQCSMLRYTFTEETRKIYNTLGLTADEAKNATTIITKLETFAKGTVNETMERHTFNSRRQEEGEPFDDFLTELKHLSKNCNFCENCHDGLLRDRIVAGVRDHALRQKLLGTENLDLKKAEELCRSTEKAKQGVKLFHGPNKTNEESAEVNEIRRGLNRTRFQHNSNRQQHNRNNNNRNDGGDGGNNRRFNNKKDGGGGRRGQNPPAQQQPPCKFCTCSHQFGRQFCPAYEQQCSACGQMNHFQNSRLCKKKQLRNLNDGDYEDGDEEDCDFLFLDRLIASDGEETEDEEFEEVTTEPIEVSDAEDDEDVFYDCDDEATEDEEDEFFDCFKQLPEKRSLKNKRKRRRRGPRNPKKKLGEKDPEEEALLCPLAQSTDEKKKEGMSWEVHIPGTTGEEIQFKIDTGADVTVVPEEDLHKLGLTRRDIRKTRKRLFGPGKQRLRGLGYVKTKFTWGSLTSEEIVYVCVGLKRALLGKPAIRSLKIVELNIPENYQCGMVEELIDEVQKAQAAEDSTNDDEIYPLLKEFPQIHGRLGKIEVGEPIHIKVKEGAVPHQTSSPRHIPLPQLKKVVAELQRMEKLGVIRKIDKPTEWCHPIVVVNKPNGDIRLCIDLTKLNAAVERELHHLESVEETMAKLGNECVYMTKIDANSGYWQIPLDESSQELTTFITPIGRFCSTRGPYGLNSMQEIFGKKMDVVIDGLEGVAKSTDDFLVIAKKVEVLRFRTRKLFERFAQYGVTVNLKKCIFEKTQMEFLGHQVSEAGILPMSSKMEAVQEFPQPKTIKELRRFMGMANQMAKFNPDLAEASAPLRDLLSTKNHWVWTENHTEAFEAVKKVLTSPKTLKLYDVSLPTKIRVDGSKLNGISVIVYQQHGEHWHPVTCGSRYLKPTEKNWYPIENEMLAVTWGCTKMNMYFHGLPHFTVETDHKPLIPILNSKQLTEMSPRIQNMRMKLLKYSFTAVHVPGAKMEDADALSRAPHQQPSASDDIMDEEISFHVAEVVKNMPVSTPYLKKIILATKKDETLQLLLKTMQEGWPKSRQLCNERVQPFWDSRHDLTTHRGLLMTE